jgi:hypothetical protein
MKPDAFAEAKTAGFPKGRGQILGTGLGRFEHWVYAVEATKKASCWPFLKPSNRLELLTPSLPCAFSGNCWQAVATVSARLSRFRGCFVCDRLPPVAPTLFH